jgi:hypothetical protein
MRRYRESGGILSALLWGFLIAIVIVAAIGYYGVHFATQIRVDERDTPHGKVVKVDTPLGSVKVNAQREIDPKHLGLPVYPGARQVNRGGGGTATIELDTGDEHKQFHFVAAVYRTADPVDDVRAFYRKNLPHCIVSQRGIEYSENGYKRLIAVHRDGGETEIQVLASEAEPASN